MKKLLVCLLIFVLAAALLVACGDKETETEAEGTEGSEATETETETEATLEVGEDTEEGFGDIHTNNE